MRTLSFLAVAALMVAYFLLAVSVIGCKTVRYGVQPSQITIKGSRVRIKSLGPVTPLPDTVIFAQSIKAY